MRVEGRGRRSQQPHPDTARGDFVVEAEVLPVVPEPARALGACGFAIGSNGRRSDQRRTARRMPARGRKASSERLR
jgi:hypothetical protein